MSRFTYTLIFHADRIIGAEQKIGYLVYNDLIFNPPYIANSEVMATIASVGIATEDEEHPFQRIVYEPHEQDKAATNITEGLRNFLTRHGIIIHKGNVISENRL